MRKQQELMSAIERAAVENRSVLTFPRTSAAAVAPVCITGMHRSGTSMVASLLSACGFFLGPEEELSRPADDNLHGYWENQEFKELNKDLMASFDGRWDDPPDFPEGWQFTAKAKSFRERARDLVATSGNLDWGWKDPRCALTLPFWQQLIPDLRVIVCVRNPVEVARSLFVRGDSPAPNQFDLWLTYYRRLLAATTPTQRLVTHYHSYFHDGGAELRRVLHWLDKDVSEDLMGDACARISAGIRHHHVTRAESVHLPDDVLSLYFKLCAEAGPVYQESRRQEASNSLEWPDSGPNDVKALARELQRLRDTHHEIINSKSFRLVLFWWRLRRRKAIKKTEFG